MASIINELLPSICKQMHNYFNLAIDDICPVDGKDPGIPPLKNETDIDEHVDELVTNLDNKFSESAD